VVKKSAFTLIELIFAIIVIAITVVSLPVMNQVLAKDTDANLIQEAVFAAATELNELTTVHWDENSIDPNNANGLANVINIDNTCENNISSSRYRFRPGHILQPYHRRCLNNLTQTAAHTHATAVDAVEDQLHLTRHIFLNPSPSEEGYKNDYNSTLTITSYTPSFNATPEANLKQVTANILDENGNTLVSLTTYIANIGEVDYYKRTY